MHSKDTGTITDTVIEFSGANRPYYDGKVRLGKKLNIFNINPQLKRHISYRGMSHVNLIAEWENVIGKIYAEYSVPDSIKNISNVKTLICKVKYTRIIEFQHQKTEFIKQINLFAGTPLIEDIKFVRVDKLPQKRKKTIPKGLTIPNEKHQKLLETTTQCSTKELEKSFHDLAHIIMPVIKSVQNINHDILLPDPKENLLTSWRNRAKNILNCSHK